MKKLTISMVLGRLKRSFWLLLSSILPEQNKANIIVNAKRNWYFPISALAFFCLNVAPTVGYLLGIPIAFGFFVVISSQTNSLFVYTKESSVGLRIVSFLTAIGICWAEQSTLYAVCSVSSKVQRLEALLPFTIDILSVVSVVSVVSAMVALYFVYFCVLVFWEAMTKTISQSKAFYGITRLEKIVYAMLLVVVIAFIVVVFSQSKAFYGAEYLNIIYSSDSSSLVKGNVYVALTHPENDLRQPLFAVFAGPLLGIPYLISKLLAASASIQAMLLNIVQIVILFTANFLLAKMMKLDSCKRMCFVILSSFTYTHLLFILMMEQYIVAYFWLIFCLYLISEKRQPDRIVLWGAGGTLLTSMILLPFLSDKSPLNDIKAWFLEVVKYGLEFIGVMLIFCRFDVIYNLNSKVAQLSGYTGKSISIVNRLYQYTNFLTDCFFAPNAGVNTTAHDYISWQLNAVTTVSIAGLGILLLVILSAFLNRTKKSSLLAIGWVAFSIVMLFGLGWGTKENGLVLYALYFGWAFLVLIFQLVECIDAKLHTKILVPVISLGSTMLLAAINIPAIMEMIDFAITYYPAQGA